VEHLSLYQLTIEPDTWFERLYPRRQAPRARRRHGAGPYDVTQEVCEARAPAYEISNHARPGAESRPQPRLLALREICGHRPRRPWPLVPNGASPPRPSAPETWLEAVEREGHGLVEEEWLTAEAEGDEFLLMGLRLREGIDPGRYRALTGRALDGTRIGDLEAQGFLARRADARLAVTREGFPVLNAVIGQLAA
jgi:oxygen-independent coproporphyrinogen-3 oxidase